MMKTGESSLFPLLYDYLKTYLPKQRNVSHNKSFHTEKP